MSIIALPAFNDNYIWSIINEQTHSLTCVDPGDATPVLTYLEKNHLTLQNVLLTHHHADHMGGVPALLKAFPTANIYAPNDARFPFPTTLVRDEDILHIDTLDFRVLSTPGHTSTGVSYQEPTKGWLFCGDTLFSGGCGRVFDGTMEALYRSILLLKSLPDHTHVYCGHEYTRQNLQFAATIDPTNETLQSYMTYLADHPNQCSLPSTIALEKKINPFMRTDNASVKAMVHDLDGQDSFSIFKRLRELKDNWQS